MARAISYPDWICDICGVKYGRWYNDGDYVGPTVHYPTYHMGRCDVCGEDHIMVTEPRDFGHFLDWDVVQNRIRENSNKSKKSRKTGKPNAT